MKNLSLHMTPASALNTIANKSERNMDKSSAVEPDAFKTMLSNQLQNQSQTMQMQERQSQDRKSMDKLTQGRQLQDKQLQDKQLQDKQLQDKQLKDKQLQKNEIKDSPDLAKQNATKPEHATAAEKSQQPLRKIRAQAGAEQDSAEMRDTLKVLADKASALASSKTDGQLPWVADAARNAQLAQNHASETNAANLAAAFNVAVINPQLQAQSAEAAGSRQKNIDNVLSQALTQSKIAAVADKNDAQTLLASKDAMLKANWLDDVLPTAMRQAAGDELAQNKSQQTGVQQAGVHQNAMQQSLSQQNSAQITSLAQNTSQQNSVQQAATFAANIPQTLSAGAAGPALAAAQAGSSSYISAQPGKTGWDQAISQKVMWMAGEGGVQSATLTLNPPDLGPLQVVIHVNNDQVDAQFMSDNADVRQALEDGLANLRDKMSEAGIQLGQTNVSAGGQAQQEFGQTASGQRAPRMASAESISSAETIAAKPAAVRAANGLVDTFA